MGCLRSRLVVILAMGLVMFSIAAGAVDIQAADENVDVRQFMNMFARVNPVVAEDQKTVVVFFDFGCPHCAEHLPGLLYWADSLPSGVNVRFSPAIMNDIHRTRLAHTFYLAIRVLGYTGSVPVVRELFASEANQHPLTNQEAYELLARYAPDKKAAAQLFGSEVTRPDMERSLQDFAKYNVHAVPAVGIAGKFLVTPDDIPPSAAINYQQAFTELINGFVSRMIAGDL